MTDMAAYWRNELGVDVVIDDLTLTQFEAELPAIHLARKESSEANEVARRKTDAVDTLEDGAIEHAVNVRKFVDLKYGKNSRQYKSMPKVPRYDRKATTTATSTGSGSGSG
jgi:hypothetical protein